MFLSLQVTGQLALLVFYIVNQMTIKRRSACFLNVHKNHHMGRIAYIKPGTDFDFSFQNF